MRQTMPDTDVPRAATIDSQYDASNHAPFAPLTAGLSDVSLAVDGWECAGHINQTDAEWENYELRDGEWVHVETETVETDEHYITWTADAPLPSVPESDRRMVTVEYGEDEIHFENGEPVEMAPGYTTVVYAGAEGTDQPIGSFTLGTYKNLAAALEVTLAYLHWVEQDGDVPDSFDPASGESLEDILESIGLPRFPDAA